MDIQSYIESGILESYVNGLLSEDENREVDELAKAYPEIRQEIAEIQEALKVFAESEIGKGPSLPSLESVMRYAEAHPIQKEQPDISPLATDSPPVYPISKKEPNWLTYALAAAVALLIMLGILTTLFYQRFQRLEQQVASLQQSNTYITEQYARLRKQPVVIEPHNHIVADPGSEEITMVGLDPAPEAEVKVYWHSPTKDVYLVIQALPEPPKGHQYQLWAIIDGISVDAGIFDHHTKMQKLRTIDGKVTSFAVTLEEKGGRPVPNLKQMYAKGEVKI